MSNTIIIINATPFKEQPIPEIDKTYHIFDDGKVSLSRHYLATIRCIIPFAKADADLVDTWRKQVDECYWLFAKETDYFVVASSVYEDPLYFVRTTDGGWFSIDYSDCWGGARLDIDGKMYESMMERMK